eukprot:3941380-Rhodomonas_salina.2
MSLAKSLLYWECQSVWFAKSPRTKGKRKRKKEGIRRPTGREWCAGVGAQISDRSTVNHKAFADDIGMVVNTPGAAQNLLNSLAEFCEWSGMEVNMLKTQATAIDFSTNNIPADLAIESTADAVHLSNKQAKPREFCSLTFNDSLNSRLGILPTCPLHSNLFLYNLVL